MTRKELDSFKEFVRRYTATHTKTKKAAKAALIREGLYDKNGQLKIEFGGEGKQAKAA